MEHLSLELCKRLKEAGYPQDAWPQMVVSNFFGAMVGDPNEPEEDFTLYWLSGLTDELDYEISHGAVWYACPPIITADGHGGVLPWLMERLREHPMAAPPYVEINADGSCDLLEDNKLFERNHRLLNAEKIMWSPEALIAAALDALDGAR